MQAGQDGEDRLLALQNLLVQHLISLVEGVQARSAVDDRDGVDVVKPLLAIINGCTKNLACSCSQYVDRVADTTARQQLGLQFVCYGSFELRHFQSPF